ADATVVVGAQRGGVGEEKRSENLAFVGVGADVAFVVDGEVFGLGAGGSGDVAVDGGSACFVGEATEAEAEFTVATQAARRFGACDDAFKRGAFRDEEVVIAVEDGARDGGGDGVAGFGGSRVKWRDEARGDGDGVEEADEASAAGAGCDEGR